MVSGETNSPIPRGGKRAARPSFLGGRTPGLLVLRASLSASEVHQRRGRALPRELVLLRVRKATE